MAAYCSVLNCPSSSKTKTDEEFKFHRIPKSAEYAEKWKVFCQKKIIPDNGFVCSKHFRDEDYEVLRIALTKDEKPKTILKKNGLFKKP